MFLCRAFILAKNNCIIASDININWKEDENRNTKKLKNEFSRIGFKQIVKQYIRITKDTRTVTDFVFTNMQGVTVQVKDEAKITDHETLMIIIDTERTALPDPDYYKRFITSENKDKIAKYSFFKD